MRIDDFTSRLCDSIFIADGAMGSLLYELSGPQRCLDELNATQPDSVFRVHQSYIEAGAQVIETNTFGANRHKLSQVGLADRVVEFNHRGMKIARDAREAARHEVLIAGSIGPLGSKRPARELSAGLAHEIFREQAGALEERGADFLLLETFPDFTELLVAIDSIRSFSRLPIVAELTFSEECATLDGTLPARALALLREKDVQAAGANCTVGPQSMLAILREFASANTTQLSLSSMPNAGFPKRVGDRIVYPRSSPGYFAAFARDAAALGVRILGGCCGTTPEHVRAMAEVVASLQRGKGFATVNAGSAPPVTAPVPQAPDTPTAQSRPPQSAFWEKLAAGNFTLSVEIDPPKGVTIDRILEDVRRVMASGRVDVIDINSGTLARVGMDALVLAGALEAHGIPTLPHITTRDANIIGLQAMLLGAWAAGGVRNVLAITGDPPSLGDYPEISGVYEVDSVGLVRILSRLNQGTDWAGKQLGGATNFAVGVALNPAADDLDEELRRFEAKIAAGAHFAMTQPLFDPAPWHAFLKRLGGKPSIPVLAGIWPLTSYKQALRLNNEVPGIVIPEAALREMECAGTAARDAGFALARRMLVWARTELAGAYLIPPFKRYEEILEIF